MTAPRGLGAAGRRAWHDTVEALEALGVNTASQKGRLERYARSVDVASQIEADWRAKGAPTEAIGSSGQIVPYPALKALRDQTRLVEQIHGELMPSGAAGWPRGVARSPDRRGLSPRTGGKVVALRPPEAARRVMGDDAG